MRFIDLGLAVISALIVTAGQLLIKRASLEWKNEATLLSPSVYGWVLVAFVVYGLGALVWLYTLRNLPLSWAYPFLALTFILVPVCSMLFFNERLYPSDWIALALIFSGVALSAIGRRG